MKERLREKKCQATEVVGQMLDSKELAGGGGVEVRRWKDRE